MTPASRPSCSAGVGHLAPHICTQRPHLLYRGPCWPIQRCPGSACSALGPGRPLDCPLPRPTASPASSTPLREAARAASGCFILCVLSSPTSDFYLLLDALLHSPSQVRRGYRAVGVGRAGELRGSAPQAPLAPPSVWAPGPESSGVSFSGGRVEGARGRERGPRWVARNAGVGARSAALRQPYWSPTLWAMWRPPSSSSVSLAGRIQCHLGRTPVAAATSRDPGRLPVLPGHRGPGPAPTPPPVSLPLLVKQSRPLGPQEGS